VQAGDVLAFYGQGVPVDTGSGSDILSYPAPTPPLQGTDITLGSDEFPIFPQARTYSFAATVVPPDQVVVEGGMRKFVDDLPTVGNGGIPAAVPDTTTYEGSDYYEIALVEYTQQMHGDLPPTKLRGYVQLNGGSGEPSYLGPAIVAQKDRPVRILFRNQLPTGEAGNLFLPVDTTVMGAGMTAEGHDDGPIDGGPAQPDVRREPPGQERHGGLRALFHGEPCDPAPARRHHAVDLRRHPAPVDHPGRRGHAVPRGRQRRERARHARPGSRARRRSSTPTRRAPG
jgi:hypothetical protein